MPHETNRPAPEPRPAFQVEWAILAFCAWRSADLLNAWRHSPYDRLGWLAFTLWCAPLGLALLARRRAIPARERAAWLPWLAVALGLLGSLGNLNFLAYWGLACAIVAVPGASFKSLPWLALAVCWMPVFGWAAAHFSPASVSVLRLGLAALAAAAGGRELMRRK